MVWIPLLDMRTNKTRIHYVSPGPFSAVTGNTNENKVVGILIPAGILRINSFVQLYANISKTGTAGNCIARGRLGLADDLNGTQFAVSSVASTILTICDTWKFKNQNSLSTQVGSLAGALTSTSALGAVAVDTAQNVYVVFSIANGNAADSTVVNYLVMEIID